MILSGPLCMQEATRPDTVENPHPPANIRFSHQDQDQDTKLEIETTTSIRIILDICHFFSTGTISWLQLSPHKSVLIATKQILQQNNIAKNSEKCKKTLFLHITDFLYISQVEKVFHMIICNVKNFLQNTKNFHLLSQNIEICHFLSQNVKICKICNKCHKNFNIRTMRI